MWYNSIVAGILHSPLHGVVSGAMMLITFQGRKSGKTYTTPVEYLRQGDVLYVLSDRARTWWRNLVSANENGVPVILHLQGQDVHGTARTIVSEPELTHELLTFLHARPAYKKYLHLDLDANQEPTAASLAQAAQKYVVVKIKLVQEKVTA
jgi:deazaflavin-dependent oxidoreductase (nitroreductase family)